MEKFDLAKDQKVQAEFETWYKPYGFVIPDSDFTVAIIDISVFYKLHFELQQGVYEAYFRSVGIEVEVRPHIFIDYVKYEPIVGIIRKCGRYEFARVLNPIEAKIATFTEAARIREEQLSK